MSRDSIIKECEIIKSPRVKQVEGLFEVQPSTRSRNEWQVELPIEDKKWNIGMIVGPSGSGKTTVLKHFWEDQITNYEWRNDCAVVDCFDSEYSIREITRVLSSVGFCSPPSWLRPYQYLSNGEQFRVNISRMLIEPASLVAIDEFTSVVDRTVAQIGSVAISKAVRRSEKQLVVASCHYDIEEWLQPDWVYQPHINKFTWRSVQRHPQIKLEIKRVHRSMWKIFGKHHYMNTNLATSAQCWAGFYKNEPVVFLGMLHFPHERFRNGKRISRVVTLPDYQGVGFGKHFCEAVSRFYRASGCRVYIKSSTPSLLQSFAKSPKWRMTSKMNALSTTPSKNIKGFGSSFGRPTASFEFIEKVDTNANYLKMINEKIRSISGGV